MLIIQDLTKKYKNKIAVNKVSFNMENGVYALLGSNGSGKTTLMNMICGILKATEGSIKYNNLETWQEEYRELLGYLPQDFGYYEDFKAEEFLEYMAIIKGYTKNVAKQKTREMLKLVNLEQYAKKRIKTFSGGMKRRVGIAQAIINNPKILILDEPTVGLDPKERVKFRNIISKLSIDRIVLLSTHIVSDIEDIANNIIIMKDGQIMQNGKLENIIKKLENKIFEIKVKQQEIEKIYKDYKVINFKNEGNEITLKIISDEILENAKMIEPNLEDLYLYYFGE